jgi:hypothetical protein
MWLTSSTGCAPGTKGTAMHDPSQRHPYIAQRRARRPRPLADIALAIAIGTGLAWWLVRWAAA